MAREKHRKVVLQAALTCEKRSGIQCLPGPVLTARHNGFEWAIGGVLTHQDGVDIET